MLYTEFNIDDAKEVWQDEAVEAVAIRMLQKGDSPKDVAERVDFPVEKVVRLSERITKH